MKELDPISWKMAASEWESKEASEGLIASFDGGNTYYSTHDIETFLDEQDLAEVEAVEEAAN